MPNHSRARLRPALAGVAAAVALAAAAGCSPGHASTAAPSGGQCQPAASARCTDSTAPGAPAGPVTVQQAASILARYIEINNEANRQRSARLNDEIETGALQAQSRAQYRQYPYLSSKARTEFSAFTYVRPHFYIPRTPAGASGQDPWFLTVATGVDQKTRTTWIAYLVFVEVDPGTWRMAAATEPLKASTPTIALDSRGYATAVDPDNASGLALRPSLLPIAVVDNYVTGGQHDGQVFAPTAQTAEARSAYQHRSDNLRPYGIGTYTRINDPFHTIWALRTTDGGALVIASSTHGKTELITRPGASITLNVHAPERAWVNSTTVYSLTTQWTCLDAARIPAHGKVQLLGSDCEITGATT